MRQGFVRRFRVFLRIVFVMVITLVLTLGTGIILYSNGWLIPNEPNYCRVRGVDVSSWQGDIDWNILSEQTDFVYIKATEGSGLVDPKFETNLSGAVSTKLRVGCYMFFSFESKGETQASNFIRNVPKYDNMLPPAVDIEFYNGNEAISPSRDEVEHELNILLNELEVYYRVRPIIYATRASYEKYISGKYQKYDIWIRDVFQEPQLPDGREWKFWQYSDKGRLRGYSGDEQFIDLNAFKGSKDEFRHYPEVLSPLDEEEDYPVF